MNPVLKFPTIIKPKLLLHICCAPDEAWVINALVTDYELTSYFCNPNISPESEYSLRLAEAKNVAERFQVPFFEDDYQPETWETSICDVSGTPEGGERCGRCFLLRLRRTAAFCRANGWGGFTTVMSVSPHKKISLLNECGNLAAQESGVRYEPFDFKKNDGFRKSVVLSKKLGLYRQDFCGCRLSKAERDKRVAERKAGRSPAE